MGPKKAMKAMKSGLGKPVMKSALGKAKAKAKSKAKGILKNKLNKTNLEKLGSMTLDQKIEAAAKTGGLLKNKHLLSRRPSPKRSMEKYGADTRHT